MSAALGEANAVHQVRAVEMAAASLGVKLQKVDVRPPYDFEAAFDREAGVEPLAS
jgi:hypothetical protein